MRNNPIFSLFGMASAFGAGMPKFRPVQPWAMDPYRGSGGGSHGRNRQRIGKTRQRKRNRMARESRRINRRVAK